MKIDKAKVRDPREQREEFRVEFMGEGMIWKLEELWSVDLKIEPNSVQIKLLQAQHRGVSEGYVRVME